MKALKLFLVILIYAMLSCTHHIQKRNALDDFNINHANDFVNKISNLPEITSISIVDTRKDGNDFKVNDQSIFLDTSLIDQPNYYNYRKRAKELKINEDSLLHALKSFYKTGINEFNRDDNYYRCQVIVAFTIDKGYLFMRSGEHQAGDTLRATSVKNPNYHFRVVLNKQVDRNWFEYYAIK